MTNTKLIRVVEKDLVGGAVEDGDYEFVISEYGPPNNLIEYFSRYTKRFFQCLHVTLSNPTEAKRLRQSDKS